MNAKRVLEINPAHPVIKELLERVNDGADEDTKELAIVLYENALLHSGYSLKDPSNFAKRFFKIFNGAMGIPKDAPIEEPEIDLDEDEDEPEFDPAQIKKHIQDHSDDIDLDAGDHDHHGHHHHDEDDDVEERENKKHGTDDL